MHVGLYSTWDRIETAASGFLLIAMFCLLLVLILAGVGGAQAQEAAVQCLSSERLPCGGVSKEDAFYVFRGATTGLTARDMDATTATTLQLALGGSDALAERTFSKLVFDVTFLRGVTPDCLIEDTWSLTSPVSGDPQCSLGGPCTSQSCNGLAGDASIDISLLVGNMKFELPVGPSSGSVRFEVLQFYRGKQYQAPNDDDEDGGAVYASDTSNDDDDVAGSRSCKCNADTLDNCDDDGNNVGGNCPMICDAKNGGACVASAGTARQKCYMGTGLGGTTYALGHGYSYSDSKDTSCSHGNSDGLRRDCDKGCDKSLHPTSAMGLTPRDMFEREITDLKNQVRTAPKERLPFLCQQVVQREQALERLRVQQRSGERNLQVARGLIQKQSRVAQERESSVPLPPKRVTRAPRSSSSKTPTLPRGQ